MPRIGQPAPAQSTQTKGITRDFRAAPAVVQMAQPKDLFCLGDIHGDFDRMSQMLAASGLAKSDGKGGLTWTGGKSALVCTGDVIDKWSQSLPVIAALRSLQAQAAAKGGRVVVTMGNHEAEFQANPLAEKSAAFQAELKAAGIDPKDVAAGKDRLGIGQWMRNLPVAAKVGDWFFVHAGNTNGQTVSQIESSVERALRQEGFSSAALTGDNSLLESKLADGQWWGAGTSLKDNLKALGVNHLVEGHQPGKVTLGDGVSRKKDQLLDDRGKFFMIDAGLSRGADGKGAMLHVHTKDGGKEVESRIDEQGTEKELKETSAAKQAFAGLDGFDLSPGKKPKHGNGL